MLHGPIESPNHNENRTEVQSQQWLLHFVGLDIGFPASVMEESSNAHKNRYDKDLHDQRGLHEYVSEVLCRLVFDIGVREKGNAQCVENFNDSRDGPESCEGAPRMEWREVGDIV